MNCCRKNGQNVLSTLWAWWITAKLISLRCELCLGVPCVGCVPSFWLWFELSYLHWSRSDTAFQIRQTVYPFLGFTYNYDIRQHLGLALLKQATGWTIGILRFDSRRGLGIFLSTTAARTALAPIQTPIQWVPGSLSLGIKRPGREADHSPLSSVEVKECVEMWRGAAFKKVQGQLYLYPKRLLTYRKKKVGRPLKRLQDG
jgi:hypothetical protein